MSNPSQPCAHDAAIPRASCHTIAADGLRVFYREAGPAGAMAMPTRRASAVSGTLCARYGKTGTPRRKRLYGTS